MRVTESPRARLARLRLPVFAAPMFLVSGPELVVACCKAGIVGSIPAPNARNAEELEIFMRRIADDLADGEAAPWALNLVTHRTNKRLPDDLALVDKYRPPIVITALGGPAPVIETVHRYNGLVFADVNSVAYARKAVAAGVDGLVLVCAGAGGHTGDLCGPVFLQEVREFFDGYLALAGGIATGRAVLASRAMGADFAYMGTAFMAAEESRTDPGHRDMLLSCSAQDLIVTRAFTGARANMLVPSILAQGLDLAEIAVSTAKMNFTGLEGAEVKPWKGIWSAGQGVGAIKAVEPAASIVARLAEEYRAASRSLVEGILQ
ncbi:nitronate monooxygenase [Bradyrhizobium sp. U87765 SZCCT0131]|uniref:NAD(P)H-dependent flavin oxidoreductase n=1 Tax=unclassified Bradyrhizobium TaxID=2631580 RepID=UPI001BA94692|nr:MULTISPECIES: nitronate monooxygenase [unclassified Bradyrhizobium]MBR1217337.1 nitronate monooxygenase [Bradyrhizobium sp. U87765 SZCCT0131]MBR1265066.1 nitronate monooxygenase [Bradyrhizobium sp. U87765 SZCCT0134]MBR1305048.1 nitronate monooxygenase [Bradyrhizobium sp. U87765 SZCCT0110]MBR1320834.1 nitronate monooxygenase [Bradyrhizobium sp. U87765 SZCCT0109]MBR1349254.1 nitronate monooxygenase [Bradyrhizobium sp. U87765 SZCCT0048]